MSDREGEFPKGRLPLRLQLCVACRHHSLPDAELCAHCGSHIAQSWDAHNHALEEALAAVQRLKTALRLS